MDRSWTVFFAIALFLGALGIASCDTKPKVAADGYRFEGAEPGWPKDLAIRFVDHPSLRDLQKKAPPQERRAADKAGGETHAWFAADLTKKICYVHIVDPAVAYYPADIGHEVMHCLFGRWHSTGEDPVGRRQLLPPPST